jgi:sec-independent protein translocase protein TatA
MFNQIGIPGIIFIILICLLLFGSKNLPAVGHSFGQSLREFKHALSGNPKEDPQNGKNDIKE